MGIKKMCWKEIARLKTKPVYTWFVSYKAVKHIFVVTFLLDKDHFYSTQTKTSKWTCKFINCNPLPTSRFQ